MIYVRELEIWGYPGKEFATEEIDPLIGEIARDLGFPGSVLIPYHSIPDHTDVENLAISLSEGEWSLEDFTHFCDKRGLKADLNDGKAANYFLTFSYGPKLAWLHLPTESDTDSHLAFISEKLKLYSCSLIDPESLVCLLP